MKCLTRLPAAVPHVAITLIGLTVAASNLLNAAETNAPPSIENRTEQSEQLQFNRDIRPILSTACYRCHGADKNFREADLRLDQRANAIAERGDYRVISPGKPSESALVQRITSIDKSTRMPPTDEHRQLTPSEIVLLRRWIEQGARYEKHWAFISPTRPRLPKLKTARRTGNAIDHFVWEKLEKKGLRPAEEADKATLIRRVTLDLTGLPPSLEEVDAFLTDRSPGAYHKVVDRLLQSRRYAEHMARYWLDAARYADTNGFFTDDERYMWRWRDWVIDAFHCNMPFDQFTVEQLAGDLLPNPTIAQRIATGFNRNHMTTHEGGVIDEEYRVEYIIDRLETTSTTWLGMTFGCARCHDHKYDPISQKEFYQLFAFFNNGPEKGNTGGAGNALPVLWVPTVDIQLRVNELRLQVETAEQRLKKNEPKFATAQLNWEQSVSTDLPAAPADGLVAHFDMELDGSLHRDVGGVTYVEKLFGSAAHFNGDAVVTTPHNVDVDFDGNDPFSFAVWIRPETSGPACLLSKNDDINHLRGFDVMLRKGKAVVHLVHRWNSDAIQVLTSTSIRTSQWQHICVTYDGSGTAAGIDIYFDGSLQPVDVRHDALHGTIKTNQPLRIGRRSTSAAFKGLIDEVRVYDRRLTNKEVDDLVTSDLVRAIVHIPARKRTPIQNDLLRRRFLASAAPAQFRLATDRVVELRRKLKRLQDSHVSTMVMQELPEPRKTFLLMSGQYDQHGQQVHPGVPVSLPPLPDQGPKNRLSLARWLVDARHPLTSRVLVNRFWQQYFGTGIVKTVEDFGTQGEWPSHPNLLDWLAVEFVASGWDVKHMQRLIVTSATYRQSSKVARAGTADLHNIDPENRLLARGPRFRFDAEVIRDNALAISGLLVERAGGASVKPYQPLGLWKAVSYDGDLTYQQDHGDALYRRSMYTFWKRQSPPPGMLMFDAPTRETCTVRRPRTNTPQQALALMNDKTYIEASRALAQRMMTEANSSTATARIDFAFRLATARHPEPDEVQILLEIFQEQLAVYRQNERAAEMLLRVGESQRDSSLGTAEHAAWTTVASVILNLDETVTKN
jgi:hypothetical protein